MTAVHCVHCQPWCHVLEMFLNIVHLRRHTSELGSKDAAGNDKISFRP